MTARKISKLRGTASAEPIILLCRGSRHNSERTARLNRPRTSPGNVFDSAHPAFLLRGTGHDRPRMRSIPIHTRGYVTEHLFQLGRRALADLISRPRSLVLDGCPMFAPAYMGRKRILQMLSLHAQGVMILAAALLPTLAKALEGAAPRLFPPM
jgi:hypothetical protein